MLKKQSLPIHEWFAVSLIVILVALLSSIITINRYKYQPPVLLEPLVKNIEIYVEGAVEKVGSYSLPHGATLKDLLLLVKLTEEADLRKLRPSRQLRNGQIIKVPARPMITVKVIGAAEETSFKMPKGARLSEIIGKIKPHSDADLSGLQKKRKLRDGEIINIPKLT